MRTFEYRLYPNKQQRTLLMACLKESRLIYNEMLETIKTQYEESKTFPSKYDLEQAFKGQGSHVVIRVNPRFTSQKCHKCGEIVQKSLSVRTHVCPFCGSIADRDVNAAKNILKSARPGHGFQESTYPDGDCVS